MGRISYCYVSASRSVSRPPKRSVCEHRNEGVALNFRRNCPLRALLGVACFTDINCKRNKRTQGCTARVCTERHFNRDDYFKRGAPKAQNCFSPKQVRLAEICQIHPRSGNDATCRAKSKTSCGERSALSQSEPFTLDLGATCAHVG